MQVIKSWSAITSWPLSPKLFKWEYVDQNCCTLYRPQDSQSKFLSQIRCKSSKALTVTVCGRRDLRYQKCSPSLSHQTMLSKAICATHQQTAKFEPFASKPNIPGIWLPPGPYEQRATRHLPVWLKPSQLTGHRSQAISNSSEPS